MVSVGIHPTNEHIELFESVKTDRKNRALSLKLNDARNALELDFVEGRDFTLEQLAEKLPPNDCRFVVFDFEYKTFESPPRETSKLILIMWNPDSAPIKVRMPFSSTKGDLKSSFTGIQKDIQASDLSFLDYEYLRKEVEHR